MIGPGTPLPWKFDPLEALKRWPLDRRALLLHSGRFHPRWARQSILTAGVGTYRFLARPNGTGQSTWSGDPSLIDNAAFHHKPFHDLRLLLDSTPGRWLGYLSYDLGRWIERLPSRAAADRDWPIIELAYCPGWLTYDGATHAWAAWGSWADAKGCHAHVSVSMSGAAGQSHAHADMSMAPVPRGNGSLPDLLNLAAREGDFRAENLRGLFSRQDYEAAVARVLQYISAGDIFQANLAQRFSAQFCGQWPLASRALFSRLTAVSPAWYGAYLELGDGPPGPARAIASTSPELFLDVDAEGNVITRPIKGTRPASATAEELRQSEKDVAELNMIVDLLRNDLGRVCTYGSVHVPEPRVIESHPTVHHGVATITGRLHQGRNVVDLLRAAMPGGSITGAPKIRAMQIIDELEPVRRGPYCGAIGFLSRDESRLNIAIRTLLLEQQAGDDHAQVDFSVGGGIVADSVPSREFEETLDKAAAMLGALGLPAPGTNGALPGAAGTNSGVLGKLGKPGS